MEKDRNVEKLEICRQMLESWLVTPVSISSEEKTDFVLFEKLNCFDKNFQPFFSANRLKKFCTSLQKYVVYIVQDPLGMTLIIFLLEDQLVMVGPYTQTYWNNQESEHTLSEQGISVSYLNAYKLYKCQYSVLNNDIVLRGVVSLIEMSGRISTDYFFQEIILETQKTNKPIHIAEEYSIDIVNKIYKLETEFSDAIRYGDAEKALEINRNLSKYNNMSFSLNSSWNVAMGLSIMRTMVRLAAKDSGLPPIVVDAISRDYAQRLKSLGHTYNEANIFSHHMENMIRDICKEIRKMKSNQYSSLIVKASNYIQLNLAHDLSVSKIARKVLVSPNYLSKQFKTETGINISKYVIRERCRKAAKLIVSTQHSVQEISNYVGYSDNNYFVKIFRSEYGMTPSEYRKKHRL